MLHILGECVWWARVFRFIFSLCRSEYKWYTVFSDAVCIADGHVGNLCNGLFWTRDSSRFMSTKQSNSPLTHPFDGIFLYSAKWNRTMLCSLLLICKHHGLMFYNTAFCCTPNMRKHSIEYMHIKPIAFMNVLLVDGENTSLLEAKESIGTPRSVVSRARARQSEHESRPSRHTPLISTA